MDKENTRLATFVTWPLTAKKRPGQLARIGFYYTGEGENIVCFFCLLTVSCLEAQDTLSSKHRRDCPMISKNDESSGNGLQSVRDHYNSRVGLVDGQRCTKLAVDETDTKTLNPEKSNSGRKFPVVGTGISNNISLKTTYESVLEHSGRPHRIVTSNNADHLHFDGLKLEDDTSGLRQNEASHCSESPRRSTGWSLLQNESRDEHRTRGHSSERQVTVERRSSTEFIRQNSARIDNDIDDTETAALLRENCDLKSARTCKICLSNEVSVVFLPCGHLVSCATCAPQIHDCAVCRTQIRGTVKIFLAL